ncbi:flagellar brake protein [Herbaspirillum sp. SJZ107]|uniref:flagellar brake protein n=1 Tax=Herbaspirillum sp. SJZ107 TaxID=2572881 RepID=UPI00114FD69B|nr:flagellar brake protein [Herbaspirillum sp. SJZ107]TQK06902.1 c-di-GMP-binding flagellar brake protein YcgR [Herbaspirillum sp. SJZ107]
MHSDPAVHEMKPQEFVFEAMNLQVGVRLQFITYRRLKPVQYFSTLIGYIKDDYLIVKMPMENGAPIGLVEGERVTIRVFSGVNVCSFACTVERIFGRPLLYVHLSFPTSIQGTSLRTAMRVKVDLPARITAATGDATALECTLANISVSGARIETHHSLVQDIGEMLLEFTLAPPPEHHPVSVRARAAIRNINAVRVEPGEADVFAYGLQFIDLDPNHFMLLQNLTYEALLADRHKIV